MPRGGLRVPSRTMMPQPSSVGMPGPGSVRRTPPHDRTWVCAKDRRLVLLVAGVPTHTEASVQLQNISWCCKACLAGTLHEVMVDYALERVIAATNRAANRHHCP